jgi:hypothetical protein
MLPSKLQWSHPLAASEDRAVLPACSSVGQRALAWSVEMLLLFLLREHWVVLP